jgi:hypothetical protein
VRTEDFSGDRIDQALLTHVVGDLSSAGSFDSSATSAIGSLNKLRTACRYAKERLSSTMETEMTPEVPGHHGEIRLSRVDLEDAIRQPLHGFVDFLHEVLERNGIRPTDLAAIATVGGGASIPLVTRTLSEQSGALVVTAPRPHLTAAVGAALRAARGPGDSETALAPTAAGSAFDAMTVADFPREPASAQALAWSEAGDDSGIMPIRPGEYGDEPGTGSLAPVRARPRQDLAAEPVIIGDNSDAWYRRPVVVAVGTALAVLAIGAGVLLTIRHTSGSTPTPSVSTTPAPATSAPTSSVSSDSQAPASNPPSSTPPDTSTAPSTTSETPTTTTTTEAPTTTTTTSQPPTTTTQGPDRPDRPRFPREPGGR